VTGQDGKEFIAEYSEDDGDAESEDKIEGIEARSVVVSPGGDSAESTPASA